MSKLFLIASVLLLSAGIAVVQSADFPCATPPDNCAFYGPCVEQLHSCGESGYALGFGQKYCQAITDRAPDFSPVGQKWISYVRPCLQSHLYKVYNNLTKMSCDDIAQYGLQSHFPCYVQGVPSFCDLPWSDRFLLLWIIKGAVVSPFGFSISTQGFSIFFTCATTSTQSMNVTMAVPATANQLSSQIDTLMSNGATYLSQKYGWSQEQAQRSLLLSGVATAADGKSLTVGLMVSLNEEAAMDHKLHKAVAGQQQQNNAVNVAQQVEQALLNGELAAPFPVLAVNIDQPAAAVQPNSNNVGDKQSRTFMFVGLSCAVVAVVVAAALLVRYRRSKIVSNSDLELPLTNNSA